MKFGKWNLKAQIRELHTSTVYADGLRIPEFELVSLRELGYKVVKNV